MILEDYIKLVESDETEVTKLAKELIVLCADAFVLGCNWALLMKDDAKELFKNKPTDEEREFIKHKQVENGYVIEVNREYLKWIINEYVPGAVGKKYDDVARNRKEEEEKKFDRFLDRVLKGTDSHLIQGNKYNTLCVGIYSVNEVQLVRVDGVEYPAYRLTLEEFLDKLYDKVRDNGNLVGIKVAEGEGYVYKTILNYKDNGNINKGFLKAVEKGMSISDTGRSTFVEIKIKND